MNGLLDMRLSKTSPENRERNLRRNSHFSIGHYTLEVGLTSENTWLIVIVMNAMHPTLSPDTSPALDGMPRALLRAEGIAVLITAVLAYHHLRGDWLLFAAVFLVPDLSLLGYLAGPGPGALSYNIAHSYLFAAGIAVASLAFGISIGPAIAAIWVAHIGFDRMLGYGLKYPTAFSHTHLGRIGRMKELAC